VQRVSRVQSEAFSEPISSANEQCPTADTIFVLGFPCGLRLAQAAALARKPLVLAVGVVGYHRRSLRVSWQPLPVPICTCCATPTTATGFSPISDCGEFG
jgi:hypothetical protein